MSSRRRRRTLCLLASALGSLSAPVARAQISTPIASATALSPPPPPPLALAPEETPRVETTREPLPPPPVRRPAARGPETPAEAVKSSGAGHPSFEAAPARGDFVHDGFYLRLALGGSYGLTRVQTDRVSQPDVRMSGFGGAFDLWCGWTLANGLILGPVVSVSSQRSGHATISGQAARAGVATSALVGAFLDAYPNPRRGEHFGGLLALATLAQRTADEQAATDFDGAGVGLSAFAGYDAWIGRAWSLGALLRLGGSVTRGSQSVDDRRVEKQATSYGAALLVTMVYQ